MSSENKSGGWDDLSFRIKRIFLGANRVRRTRVYCIGMGKTGTHSLAAMFSKNVRAVHEPDPPLLISKILDWKSGKMTEAQFVEWILQRDRQMALEIDSSNLNFHFIHILMREFPDAKFIHSIRDCYSWLDSVVNHQLRYPKVDPQWNRMRDYRFGSAGFVHAPEDKILKEHGLYPLESYLSLWKAHNDEVLAKIPAEKLFIVRTDQIKKRAYEIADFCGVPHYTVQLEQTHAFQNLDKKLNLRHIDRARLDRLTEKYCRPLMTRFFPEIKSLDDTKL